MEANSWIKNNYDRSSYFNQREIDIGLKIYGSSQENKESLREKITLKPKQLIEGSFMKIPNQIIETIYSCDDFTGQEIKLLLFIIRRTLGFNKFQTQFKVKDFLNKLNMKRPTFYVCLNKLIDKNIIIKLKSEKNDKKIKIFTEDKLVFNMFWDTWDINYNNQLLDHEENEEPTIDEMLEGM